MTSTQGSAPALTQNKVALHRHAGQSSSKPHANPAFAAAIPAHADRHRGLAASQVEPCMEFSAITFQCRPTFRLAYGCRWGMQGGSSDWAAVHPLFIMRRWVSHGRQGDCHPQAKCMLPAWEPPLGQLSFTRLCIEESPIDLGNQRL